MDGDVWGQSAIGPFGDTEQWICDKWSSAKNSLAGHKVIAVTAITAVVSVTSIVAMAILLTYGGNS